MKIIQVSTQMEAGGAQKVASLLTTELRRRGHQSLLYFLYKKRPAYAEGNFVRCLCSSRPRGVGWVRLASKLLRLFREEKPEAVITHTHSANEFAAPIAALAGIPVRIAVHHNPVETYSRVARAADRAAFRMGCYSKMVTVSGGVLKSFADYSSRYRSRLHRIYNGIPQLIENTTDSIREHYRIPASHAVLVNVGRLARQKNQGMLLRMLEKLPGATLLLVGEGEMGAELWQSAYNSGVADRVRFTGELPERDVATILSQADLFLLPSLFESFSMAAVEAMQQGLPVVASDLPCLREVLGAEQQYFALGDEGALLNIVRRLMKTPAEGARMAAAGRLRSTQFSVERMVGEYESLIEEELLYAPKRSSTTHDVRRLDAPRSISRIHDQLGLPDDL